MGAEYDPRRKELRTMSVRIKRRENVLNKFYFLSMRLYYKTLNFEKHFRMVLGRNNKVADHRIIYTICIVVGFRIFSRMIGRNSPWNA